MKLKDIILILVSLSVSCLFIYLISQNLGGDLIGNTLETLRRASYKWIIFSAILAVLAYYVRAVRWKFLASSLGYDVSMKSSFWALSFGYLLNLGIPRMGEIGRAAMISKMEEIPVDKSLSTIIIERVVDFIAMLIILFLAFLTNYKEMQFLLSKVSLSKDKLLIILLLGISLLVLLYLFRKSLLKVPIIRKIQEFIIGVYQGILSIMVMKDRMRFILLSILIWVLYYLCATIVIFALKETASLGWGIGLYILAIGTIGMLIPASGGIGAYHGAIMLGFSVLFLSMGKTSEEGKMAGYSYALLSHGLQTVVTLIFGTLSLFYLSKNKK